MTSRFVLGGVWLLWGALMAAVWQPLVVRGLPTFSAPPAARAATVDRVFAARRDENRVLVLDGTTVSTIAVPSPGDLVVAPDGERLYVAVPDGVAIVDVARAAIVDTVRADGVNRLALSGDGRRLFTVATTDQGTIVGGLDLRTRTSLPELAVEWGIVSTAVASPDGVVVYLGHRYYSGILTVVDLDTHRSWQAPTLEDGVAELALTPDGRRLYAANGTTGSGRVSILDTGTGRIVAEPNTVSDPASLALDPKGRLYTANFSDQSVSAIDIATLKQVDKVAVDPWPASLALSPGGGTLYVAHNGGTLVAIDTASNQVTPLPLNPATTAFAAPVQASSPDTFAARSSAYAALARWLSRAQMAVIGGLGLALTAGAVAGLFSRRTRGMGIPAVATLIVAAACWMYAQRLATDLPIGDWIYAMHRDVHTPLTPALAMLCGGITTALVAATMRGRRPSIVTKRP